jgi:membrane-bound lytic murein transglycosylase B
VDPEPLDDLMSHYREAEAATGIDWRVLAAINLIETGMGRIVGLSSAGAQGPMQFLPTTWEEVADGGDINDAHDAIQGAARYLVRRGGLDDIRDGLWGYNNSDNYVNAVLTYVELLETDERALRGLYNWEIYVGTDAGTLWLPVGFSTDEPLPANRYLSDNPWARTL